MPGTVEHLNLLPLPPWGRRICRQLRLTIFRRFVELSPGEGPVQWRHYGRLIGVGLRELGFLEHDLQGGLDERDVTESLDELLAALFRGGPADALLAHLGQSLENALHQGLGLPPAGQHEFLTGLAEGQVLFLDPQGQFVGDRGRTTVYFELLSRWPEIEAMRRASPAPTCLDLYQLVAPALGDKHLERFEWFCDVCDELGLFLKRRGRPRKSAQPK